MDTLSFAARVSTAGLSASSFDLTALGGAYLFALVNVVVAAGAFAAARCFLVVSPNRASADYGLYAAFAYTVVLVATVLENRLLPAHSAILQYAAVPQLVGLLAVHVAVLRRREPWLVTLGASATAGAIATVAVAAVATDQIRTAHWLAALLLGALLVLLWTRSVSTKRAYTRAGTIYLASKESAAAPAVQAAGLGLWPSLALTGASFLLTVANAMLEGASLEQVPVLRVTVEALLLLAVTAVVSAIPALAYWLARRSWMPELTRFVWLVWLIVGFAFSYGNFLSMD